MRRQPHIHRRHIKNNCSYLNRYSKVKLKVYFFMNINCDGCSQTPPEYTSERSLSMEILETPDTNETTVWVSLALFGESPIFLNGLIKTLENVFEHQDLKAILYYDDTVPSKFITNLRNIHPNSHLELVDMTEQKYPQNECRASWRFIAFSDPKKINVVSLDLDYNEIKTFTNKYMYFFEKARGKCWWGMSLAGWYHMFSQKVSNSVIDACYLMKSGCFVEGIDSVLLKYCRQVSGKTSASIYNRVKTSVSNDNRVGYCTDEKFIIDELIPLWRKNRHIYNFILFRSWRSSINDIVFSDINLKDGRKFKMRHHHASLLDGQYASISSSGAEIMSHALERAVLVKDRSRKIPKSLCYLSPPSSESTTKVASVAQERECSKSSGTTWSLLPIQANDRGDRPTRHQPPTLSKPKKQKNLTNQPTKRPNDQTTNQPTNYFI